MAPNLALLTLTPDFTGLAVESTKPSRLRRLYRFIRATSRRRS